MSSEENFTNIYINNLDNSVNEASLRQICERICGIGTVKTLVIFKARNEHSMGYGFCNFINHQCALRAIKYMNSMIIGSKKISAARATPKNDRDQYKRSLSQLSQAPERNANVYIKNFDSFVNEEFLRNAFSRFGQIINVRIMRNLSGFSKGFGFVSFARHEDALNAIKGMNGTSLAGRIISVDFYTPKNTRKFPEKDNRAADPTTPTAVSATSSDDSSPELMTSFHHPEIDFPEYDIDENAPEMMEDDEASGEFGDFRSEKLPFGAYDVAAAAMAMGDDDNGDDDDDANITLMKPFDDVINSSFDRKPFIPFFSSNPSPLSTPYCGGYEVCESPFKNLKGKKSYKIIVHNLRYVFDEREVRKIFYDFKDFKVKQVLNSRLLPTGDWKVSFSSEKDMERALSICNTLIVRGQKIFANEYKKIPSMYRRKNVFTGFSDVKRPDELLKTSFSSPSTPQFRPRAQGTLNLGECDAIGGEKEEEMCKKRSLSLSANVPPQPSLFAGNRSPALILPSATFSAIGSRPTQGCKSCNEQMMDTGIYDGPLSSLNNTSDLVMFNTLDNAINTPFSPSTSIYNYGF